MSNGSKAEAGQAPTRADADTERESPRLELYTHEYCAYCQTVIDVMEETGILERVVLHDVLQDTEKMEQLIRMTGKKQVPCLVVDGKPMHESKDIKRFLLETFSD